MSITEGKLDLLATNWVCAVVPTMYEVLDRAGITYNEEMLCHALSDGYKAGYLAALADLVPPDAEVGE